MKILKGIFISLLMLTAAARGVYCAKLYTTPYSYHIVEQFDESGDRKNIKIDEVRQLLKGVMPEPTLIMNIEFQMLLKLIKML